MPDRGDQDDESEEVQDDDDDDDDDDDGDPVICLPLRVVGGPGGLLVHHLPQAVGVNGRLAHWLGLRAPSSSSSSSLNILVYSASFI